MRNTIQTRHYSPRQAALLQQHPSDIIEAIDGAACLYGPQPIRSTDQIGNVNVIVINGVCNIVRHGTPTALPQKTLTSGVKALLPSFSRPTGSAVSEASLNEFLADDSWSRWAEQAKEALRQAASVERHPSTAVARLRVERLSALQATLGFTTQDLAAALKISRQQLYNWLDAANNIQPHEASRMRLAAVERIAKEWASHTNVPLSSMSREILADGSTALAKLSAGHIDETALGAAFRELATKLQDRPKSRSQRLREAGFTKRITSLPSDE